MTDIQVTLVTHENMGDHGETVRLAHNVEPEETVAHLVERLMRLGEFQPRYTCHEPPSAVIELRYVDGTQPEPAPMNEAPF